MCSRQDRYRGACTLNIVMRRNLKSQKEVLLYLALKTFKIKTMEKSWEDKRKMQNLKKRIRTMKTKKRKKKNQKSRNQSKRKQVLRGKDPLHLDGFTPVCFLSSVLRHLSILEPNFLAISLTSLINCSTTKLLDTRETK